MSLEIRVSVEVGDSDGTSIVRLAQVETILRAVADSSDSDLVALGDAALERMLADVGSRANDQLGQMLQLVDQEDGA